MYYIEQKKKSSGWIGVAIIFIVMIVAFIFTSGRDELLDKEIPVATSQQLEEITLFKRGLGSQGIIADDIGFHGFSPNEKLFFFSVFKEGAVPANSAYLLNITRNEVKKLPGMIERGIDDDRVIQLYSSEGMVLYWPEDETVSTYDVGDNVFFGSLSPDGLTYVVHTAEGIRKIDIANGEIDTVSTSAYDGAYAWFNDSTHLLGFRGTEASLFEAGKARELGVWNIKTKTFSTLATTITDKTMRMISWVIPDRVARVTTGWDDGSHDYLLDVKTNEVIDLGDTSGALMSGIDTYDGLLAIVGGDDASELGSRVLLYKGMIKKGESTLPKGYFRQDVTIVDDDRLIYTRNTVTEQRTTKREVVVFSFSSGKETVMSEIPLTGYSRLSFDRSSYTWVLSHGNQFITGVL